MSSITRKIDEQEEKDQYIKDIEWLENVAENIKAIKPNTPELSDLKWIEQNKEKILGNRRLIELLR